MSEQSHCEAFRGKQKPPQIGALCLEDQLKALVHPPEESRNAAPIRPGPGLRKPLRDQANRSALLGTIVYLGQESVHPADSWVKLSQPQVNPGAHGHPVMIIARQDNLVLCAPCTSWNGKTPQEKWSNARSTLDNQLFSHMELLSDEKPADCATSAQLGGLYHTGRKMEKRTFMSLQRAFWTEIGLLEEYTQGDCHRQLTEDSFGTACWAYTTAYAWRQQKGISDLFSQSKSRIPSPSESWRLAQRSNGNAVVARKEPARRSTASKEGVYKALRGGEWRGKEGRRRSGGLTQRGSTTENWRGGGEWSGKEGRRRSGGLTQRVTTWRI